jgi:hypothetical protein
LLTSWPRLIRITSSVDAGHESRRGAVGAFGASNRKDSTPRCGRRLLRCGISTRLCPLWVNLNRVDRGGTPIHVRYASKSDEMDASQRGLSGRS